MALIFFYCLLYVRQFFFSLLVIRLKKLIVDSECGTTPPSYRRWWGNEVRLPKVNCEWWSESESEKWKVRVIFGSLKFLELLYVIGGVLT